MYDFLIIGHGLAGAVLSQRLLERGKSVIVLDTPEANASSAVAAGLFNPITGRKMNKTWKADDLFSSLIPFYRELEKKLSVDFLCEIGIYRPYWTLEDQNDWEAKKSDDKFSPYIRETRSSAISDHDLKDDFGGLHLKQAGYLNIPILLEANKTHLIDKGSYKEIMFSEQEMKREEDHFCFEDLNFKKIIFCNGLEAFKTPLFGWLPFNPVKGEVMDIQMSTTPKTIYNRSIFILPFGKRTIRVGATYNKKFEDIHPTKAGEEELINKLEALFNESYNIENMRAGIRPATKDRKPFIGKHPDNEHIYLFNGFGSKGVSLIPYFSKMLTDHVLDGVPLESETDIIRYLKMYNPKN